REPAIYALARSYLEFSRDLFPFWNLLLEYQVDEEGLPAWYEEKVDAACQLIESAIARDFNVSGPELKRSARVLWAALHGITTLSHRGKLATTESEPAEVLCQSLLQTYFSGLRTLYGEAKT
ncbi:MAG: WHG domain-containing protein, partial [Chlamydiia bacterium]|nr:WHG domain-containing protein [Chlamydiia bacterium]